MRFKSHTLALAAVLAVAAVSPALASAGSSGSRYRPGGRVCYKDYSLNSANGDYCVPASASPYSQGQREVGVTPAQKVASAPAKQHDGFSWSDAGVGAGAGAALALVILVGTAGRRRHETALPVAGRSATTG